jgi:hypothetical protein
MFWQVAVSNHLSPHRNVLQRRINLIQMLDFVNWLIDLHSLSTLAEATEESQWDRWRRYWPSESSSHSQEAKDLKMKYSSERQTERDPPSKHGAGFRFYPYFTPLQLLKKKECNRHHHWHGISLSSTTSKSPTRPSLLQNCNQWSWGQAAGPQWAAKESAKVYNVAYT